MTTLEDRIRNGLAAEAETWHHQSTHDSMSGARTRTGVKIGVLVAAVVVVVVGGYSLVSTLEVPLTGAPPAAGEPEVSTSPTDSNLDSSVTTLTAPAQLIQDGLDLQAKILVDGVVTRTELVQAVAAMSDCMKSHGLKGVTWNVKPDGQGWGGSYEHSVDEAADEAISNLCFFSYVDRLPPVSGTE